MIHHSSDLNVASQSIVEDQATMIQMIQAKLIMASILIQLFYYDALK